MKNRIIAFTLALLLVLSLAGCGSSEPQTSVTTQAATNSTTSTETTTGFEDLEAIGELEVDQNLFTVEITVPADFLGEGITQESLDADAAASNYISAKLNDDGSVTYVMTKAVHDEMMVGVRDNIQQALEEMVGSEEFPSFTKVEANDDFTQFTVETTSTELGLVESFSVLGFYMFGGMYHAFNGTQVDDIAVTFINADTGDTVGEAHSSDMAG
ncbi:MAG TPA: hypothetical protein IAB83_05690 [Candidatus Faecousia faecavium]|nr:hypothetical protein [Candidatus Faecousia faecavium]